MRLIDLIVFLETLLISLRSLERYRTKETQIATERASDANDRVEAYLASDIIPRLITLECVARREIIYCDKCRSFVPTGTVHDCGEKDVLQ